MPAADAGAAASAIVTDALDVVVADRAWRLLHAPLGEVRNLAWSAFTHPAAGTFYVDLPLLRLALVARLRHARTLTAGGPGTPPPARAHLDAVVARLAARSEDFAGLWHGLAVAHRVRTPYEVRHGEVGLLPLRRSTGRIGPDLWQERLTAQGAAAEALRLALLGMP